jgi:hypothetical protein
MFCQAVTHSGYKCTRHAAEGMNRCTQHFNIWVKMIQPFRHLKEPTAADLKEELEDLLGEIMHDSWMPPTDMPCKKCGHHSPLITEHYVTKHIVNLVYKIIRRK